MFKVGINAGFDSGAGYFVAEKVFLAYGIIAQGGKNIPQTLYYLMISEVVRKSRKRPALHYLENV